MSEVKYFQIPGKELKLPLLDIHGKDYLQVAQRLVWFNLDKQDWTIETEIEVDTGEYVRAKCTIKDPSGRIIRTARKSKRVTQDKDYDSCETGAIGRCLGYLGYGTQYSGDELDEGEVVDSPQGNNGGKVAERPYSKKLEQAIEATKYQDSGHSLSTPTKSFFTPKTPELIKALEEEKKKTEAVKTNKSTISTNDVTVTFGKYKGKTLSQVGKNNLESYISWLYDKAAQDGKPVSKNTIDLENAVKLRWPKNQPVTNEDSEPPMTSYDEEIPF